jgi:hypothetical protein
MKNSNETIGNRTRDLPACSAVPQPTAPPRAPMSLVRMVIGRSGVRILESARDLFFLKIVQPCSGARPTSYSMDAAAFFPRE